MKFRICWESKTTDAQGVGMAFDSTREAAEAIVQELNLKNPTRRHWLIEA